MSVASFLNKESEKPDLNSQFLILLEILKKNVPCYENQRLKSRSTHSKLQITEVPKLLHEWQIFLHKTRYPRFHFATPPQKHNFGMQFIIPN